MTATLTGTAAVRYVMADFLATVDALGAVPHSVTVDLDRDDRPRAVQAWFRSYEHAQAVADFYGIGEAVRYNGTTAGSGDLLHISRELYDLGCPTVAGVRCGVRLVTYVPGSVDAA